ncbi:MAG: anthranilate phosphoribosyltransferase [Myxococcales bacterium]|nr:anthranilate phosphoribosyltransferase [Myxococcales bacterium]
MTAIAFREAFARLEAAPEADAALVKAVFDAILTGTWTATQIAAFAVALRLKGETPEVIAAAARSLRDHMVAVDHSFDVLLDTCGTGGDGRGSLNLSTGAALIVAAAGVPVAKHGNRAVSSRSGSADVLQELGVPLDAPPTAARSILEESRIAFLFAPAHHPAMRFVAPARKELGIRTVFNVLGPLANPARASHQLLGAFDDALRPVLARTLQSLGVKRAWVVRGADGMDEVSPFGPTRVTVVDGDRLEERVLTPEDFGIEPSPEGAIDGGDAAENARVLAAVLAGERHPSRDAFLLNAAAALCVAEDTAPRDALARAREAVDSGAALQLLERWKTVSRAAAAPSAVTRIGAESPRAVSGEP